ncbi:MAG: TetR/AcrR family transcriptional regulator [Firmicutes bacterium]|nr:TetR/AcrR family transcriptional regulator [Bacillota bacterium]MBR6700885.1 TetR/AcrR family transcriptional regulator [Bacillota bacterium]
MANKSTKKNLQEELILAGIEELNNNGFHNFSVRRIAAKCGVSCAAPYKHFKDKSEFMAAIIEYINFIWARRQLAIVKNNSGDIKKLLVEISVDYIRFLVENPHFRSILMMKDEDFDEKFDNMKAQMSKRVLKLINKFCKEAEMPDTVAQRKFYIVRALIYGASLMFDNGEIEYNEENLSYFADAITREFDLP